MKRYEDIPVRNVGAKPYRATAIYPEVPASEQDYYVIASTGDRFDILSRQFYGDQQYWWVIASANPNVRRDTMYIEPGLQLRIPPLRAILDSYETLNKSR